MYEKSFSGGYLKEQMYMVLKDISSNIISRKRDIAHDNPK